MKKIYFLFVALLVTSLSFGQVFITELADPNDNANARYIELYNAGATPVDLSTWRIDKYTNASATISQTIALTGTIPNGGFYIIATGAMDTDFNTAYGFDPDQWDGAADNVAGSNGDDNLELHNGTSVVDQFGVPGEDGTGTTHEFEDGRAERKASVTMANPTWDVNEWNIDNDSGGGAGPQNAADMDPGAWIGTSTSPTLTVGASVSGLDYFVGSGPSAEGTFTVEGINLTADIIVNAPANFEVSLSSGAGFAGSVNVPFGSGTVATTTIYTRLAGGLSANTYNGDVTVSSTGATNETVALEGTVTATTPQITVLGTVNPLNYVFGAGPSAEDTFTVEGLFLTTDIVVSAPTNFEVSLSSGTGFAASVNVPFGSGTVATTTIYTRLAGSLAVNTYNGDITISSTGVANETIALTGEVFGAPTNTLVLTGIYDGPISGNPKGIELMALANIADLSKFGISSITNGAGTSAGNIEYNFPADAVTAGTVIFLSTESTNFNSFFGQATTYTSGVVGINGDDSIELYENGVIIDTFGDVDTDGTGQAWDYTDGWAYRVSDTGPDGGFIIGNWTFSGADMFDGTSVNTDAVNPYPIASYSNVLSIADNTIEGFNLFPNPNNTGILNITTKLNGLKNVQIFDMLGKKVLDKNVENKLTISELNSGIYIIKVTENKISATKRLIVR